MLNNLKTDSSIEEEKDVLGGRTVFPTGLYTMVIDMAYLDTSKGGAVNLNLTFKDASGRSFNQTLYLTSGTAKGGLNYYTAKDGTKRYLPGFNQANAICRLTTGKEISRNGTRR